MNSASLSRLVETYVVPFGWKIVGAVALWIVGGWLIRLVAGLLDRALGRQRVEPTLIRYVHSTATVVLRIVLVIAILSVFGIETTSFAALLAAVGIAIGAAWGGLLANFAAGIFLVLFHPFRVGDFISAGGVTGTVREIGLFATTVDQPDNVRTVVGNNKIFGDNIVNYQTNPYRRVDLTAQLAHGVDPLAAMKIIAARVAQIPNVVAVPAPQVEILEFNAAGTKLVVRPSCANEDYWQVYFDTNKAILLAAESEHWPVPAPQQVVRPPEPAAPRSAAA
jgi:small conductance mechanosensitive channel